MNINVNQIKELREITGAGMMECKKALVIASGNMEKAKEYLISKFGEKAAKKSDRTTNEGFIAHYVHPNGKMGSMVALKCETDFVARNEYFKQLAFDIAMHVAAMDSKNVEDLMNESFVKDNSVTIREYVQQVIGRLGENIIIKDIVRFSI